MRKIFTAAVVFALVTGCSTMSGDRAHVGWDLHIYKPGSFDQQGLTLVQAQSGSTSAHPMGTVVGPVTEATSTHAPTSPPPATMSKIRTRLAPTSAECVVDPCAPGSLTAEQWIKIMGQMDSRRMPAGTEK